jgi:hypothetical protein
MDFHRIIDISWNSYLDFLINNYYPYWQKYVTGVNMSLIDCDPHLDNCTFEIKQEKLYTSVHSRDVYNFYSENDISNRFYSIFNIKVPLYGNI